MRKQRFTMAQALLRFLDAQYVSLDAVQHKFVAGIGAIFGHGNVTGIGEALATQKHSLHFIQGHNEQGLAHAAIGFAKQKRRLSFYAVTTSIGPGALNLTTAAGTATANRIPLLLLPGDIFASRQPDPVLQQIEQSYDYTISANDAFRPLCKYWDRIIRPEQLMSAALHAFRVLSDPAETGAVVLSLPQDTQGEAYDYPEDFFAPRIHRIDRIVPTKDQLQELMKYIQAARYPLLICGGGIKYSFAEEAFLRFAESFDIPFAETQAGKGSILWDHALNLGGIGVTGTNVANVIAKKADLIIAVGTRMGDFTTASRWMFQNPSCQFVSININRFDTYKMNAFSCVGDARETLLRMIDMNSYRPQYQSTYKREKEQWNKEVDRLYTLQTSDTSTVLYQTAVLGALNEDLLSNDAVVVASAGSLPGDLQRLWRSRSKDSYHVEYAFSCMGYEIAGAMGVKLAQPDREVYAMVGDGSFVMLHSELLTCARMGVKIVILLFDNHGFQCIDNLQTSQGIASFGNQWWKNGDEKSYQIVDFAAIARAYGVHASTVHSMQELKESLEQAKASQHAYLVHINVLAKSMSDSYESWWRVGTAQVSSSDAVSKADRKMREETERAREF